MFSFTQIRVIDQHAGIVHNGPIMVCEKVGSKVNVLQLHVHITCVRLKSGAAQTDQCLASKYTSRAL